jgi:heat-inducible transcriptional repressor
MNRTHARLVLLINMNDLTQRQVEILKSLIEEYIATAEPVGSETLEKKYSLSASPATIRNEMVKLTRLGYLKKNHTSAGRMPTPVGMKFYVKQLMKEKDLSVTEETAVKESLWDYREKENQFLREMTKSLAEKTKALAIATTAQGDVFCAGYANILDMPEFFDIDVMKNLLSTMDEFEVCRKFFEGIVSEDVQVLLGDELGPDMQGPYGFVFTHYKTPMQLTGEIGVLGPSRLNYTQIVPTVRYFGDLIEEIAKGW